MKILVPDSIDVDVSARGTHATYDIHAEIPAHHADAEVLIVWQNPSWQLAHAARTLPRLRLVQTLASGADAVLTAGFDPLVPVCSGRSLHDGPVAEHTLALILGMVRRLDALHDAQRECRWDTAYADAQRASETSPHYTLAGSRVAIWGFGSVAAALTPMLRLLGAEVLGIARQPGRRADVDICTPDEAPTLLATTDILVSLLPATEATENAVNARVLASLKAGSIFINVGRGSTVDEEALMNALRLGHLRAAAVDVARTEPLPPESPLWTAPNLVITPHVAGNRPVGAERLIAANLDRLAQGAALINLQGRSAT